MAIRQDGWIARFIIIGAVLVIATIGTAYIVEKRGEQVRRDTAIAIAKKNVTKTATATTQVAVTAPKGTTTATSATSTTSPGSSTTSTATTSQTATASASTSALPVTGPTMTLLSILPLAFLVTAVTSFLLSMRRRRAPYTFDL